MSALSSIASDSASNFKKTDAAVWVKQLDQKGGRRMKKMLMLLAVGMLALTAFGAPSVPKGQMLCAMPAMSGTPSGLL
jgi:hypothetical protein